MNLTEARAEIDRLDDVLLDTFLKRLDCADAVAEYKRANDLPVLSATRETEIIARIREASGPRADWAETFYRALFAISRDYQEARLKEASS